MGRDEQSEISVSTDAVQNGSEKKYPITPKSLSIDKRGF
jgi:hypothetical protein